MSKKQTRFAGRTVGAALLGWSLVITGAVAVSAEEAASSAAKTEQSEFQASWTFSPDDRAAVSQAGTEVRSNIEGARGAMAETDSDDVATVREQLEQARLGLETILTASPAVRIKTQLYAAATRIPVEDSENVVQALGEIERELSGMPAAASASAVRDHVKAAEQHLKDGEKRAAFEALQAADEQIVLDRADVPAAETYYLVNVAIAALANDDPEVAVQALDAASQSFAAFASAFGMTEAGAPGTS
ncbi:MAG: YfdX family protein [Myxococcota bacterium]